MSYSELAGLLTLRPLSMILPEPTHRGRYRSPFSASWSSTVSTLTREMRHLRPREAILELDLREQDFRVDGLPRANAKQNSPGVILTLVATPHGDLRYPCSTFHHWEDNVRAIALALEALRKVDRYGVTRRGEQYAGWKALTAGGPDPERGRSLVRDRFGGDVRRALRATHPDTRQDGYTDADFADVQAARGA